MKIDFKIPSDNTYHQYCPVCRLEDIHEVTKGGKTYYFCKKCNQSHERMIVIDPKIVWWIDDSGEYWHESVGVIIKNEEDKILFFDRTVFPFVLTLPAGHLDVGETAVEAAKREVMEEVGIKLVDVKLIAKEDTIGDQCRGGADCHRWHLFMANVKNNKNIKVADEGANPVWLSMDEALQKNLAFPVKLLFKKFGKSLMN